MSLAYHCEICDSHRPNWRLERKGDAVVTWTCNEDLATVLKRLQRDFEKTQIIITEVRV